MVSMVLIAKALGVITGIGIIWFLVRVIRKSRECPYHGGHHWGKSSETISIGIYQPMPQKTHCIVCGEGKPVGIWALVKK